MKFFAVLPLLFASSALGCLKYEHCQCRDVAVLVRNDEATLQACKLYHDDLGRTPVYSDEDLRHRCDIGPAVGGGIDVCNFEALCQGIDPNLYAHCWGQIQ